MRSHENNQAASEGLGWSTTEAFIERRYQSCHLDGAIGAEDLCWKQDNAVLHLNGVSTELVHISGQTWRAKDDPNWRIVKKTGAANGDNDGEYWEVTTPDGTLYQFGLSTMPASEGSRVTHSTWWGVC